MINSYIFSSNNLYIAIILIYCFYYFYNLHGHIIKKGCISPNTKGTQLNERTSKFGIKMYLFYKSANPN